MPWNLSRDMRREVEQATREAEALTSDVDTAVVRYERYSSRGGRGLACPTHLA